ATKGNGRQVMLMGGSAGGILCAGVVVAILAHDGSALEKNRATDVKTSPLLTVPSPSAARFDPAALPVERKPLHGPPELVAVSGESRQRHWGSVGCVAISVDAKVMASGGRAAQRRIIAAARG